MDVHKIMCCKTSHVVKYDAMRHAVQVVCNVDEAKVIHDQAAALIACAQQVSRWAQRLAG